MDLRPFYFNALENAGRIVAGVTEDQLDGATPCADWDTRGLLNHLIGGVFLFANAANGEKTDPGQTPPDFVAQGAKSAFEEARAAALRAWADDAVLERTVNVGNDVPGRIALRIALVEAIVHGWDLAKATGQEHGIDDMVAVAMLDGLRKTVTSEYRAANKFFGEEVPIGEDAPYADQLVAFLGRQP